MAIVSHPTKRFYGEHFEEDCLVIECDFCRELCERVGDNIEGAVEQARKMGFQTVKDPKNLQPGAPRLWWCGRCKL